MIAGPKARAGEAQSRSLLGQERSYFLNAAALVAEARCVGILFARRADCGGRYDLDDLAVGHAAVVQIGYLSSEADAGLQACQPGIVHNLKPPPNGRRGCRGSREDDGYPRRHRGTTGIRHCEMFA